MAKKHDREPEGRKCEIDECKEPVAREKPDHVFCDTHWLLLPSEKWWALFDAYTLGQFDGAAKPTQAWYDAVSAACALLEKQEKPKKKHGQRK